MRNVPAGSKQKDTGQDKYRAVRLMWLNRTRGCCFSSALLASFRFLGFCMGAAVCEIFFFFFFICFVYSARAPRHHFPNFFSEIRPACPTVHLWLRFPCKYPHPTYCTDKQCPSFSDFDLSRSSIFPMGKMGGGSIIDPPGPTSFSRPDIRTSHKLPDSFPF